MQEQTLTACRPRLFLFPLEPSASGLLSFLHPSPLHFLTQVARARGFQKIEGNCHLSFFLQFFSSHGKGRDERSTPIWNCHVDRGYMLLVFQVCARQGRSDRDECNECASFNTQCPIIALSERVAVTVVASLASELAARTVLQVLQPRTSNNLREGAICSDREWAWA